MYIKEIELNNFRIYKGVNKINLSTSKDKNIIVVSGKNGFGKTTFLMSLVWCLYGKNMQNVDDLYKKEIGPNYYKYIGSSLNRSAKSEGEKKFSVSITFCDVKIPDITCNEIKITRTVDTLTSNNDKIEVLVDGYPNELIQDLTSEGKQDGEEIFIRDFILPIEIAKFFFFDAEKVVALADLNSETEQRRLLSKAYTEVLGIKKYEDLKNQLENIQDDYRNKSAKGIEKQEFNEINANLANKQIEIEEVERSINKLEDEKLEKINESNEIQRKLIQEGNHMTLEQLDNLKKEEAAILSDLSKFQDDLKEYFDLIPFGLAGEVLMEVSSQISNEKNYKSNKFIQDNVEEKTNKILDEIELEKKAFPTVIPTEVRNFYEIQINKLVRKYFFAEIPDLPSNFETLHDFSDSEINELNSLINNLQHSFKETFTRLNNDYSRSKSQIDSIRRKISNAEKDAEDDYISNLRNEKEKLDKRIDTVNKDIYENHEKIGGLKNEIKALKQRQEELRKKIDDSRKYSAIEEKAQEVIDRLKDFIKSFKEEKKKLLEKNILNELNLLMHKKGFIKKVLVDISQSGEDVDINLFNDRDEKIEKGSLSMGERQMYASALLKALVDESDIDFPVFIDSPMQKFDKDHAENVIKEFYPNVSNQVVLFPLIHKELTESEYNFMKDKFSRAYLIHNLNTDSSKFIEAKPENLFEIYNEQYAN